MWFLTGTLFSILKIISEHTSYLSHQYNTVVYQHSLNNLKKTFVYTVNVESVLAL